MLRSYERSLQPGLVGVADVPVEGLAGSRDTDPSSSVNSEGRQSSKGLNFSSLDQIESRWKSRHRGGRPTVPLEIVRADPRDEYRQSTLGSRHGFMASFSSSASTSDRPAWPSPYMARRKARHPRVGKAFLLNHADGIAAMDLFVVPTISFRLLYAWSTIGFMVRRYRASDR